MPVRPLLPNLPTVLVQDCEDTDGTLLLQYLVGSLRDVLKATENSPLTGVTLDAWGGFEVPVTLDWLQTMATANPDLTVLAIVDLPGSPRTAVFTRFELTDVLETAENEGNGTFDNCVCGADSVRACLCLLHLAARSQA